MGELGSDLPPVLRYMSRKKKTNWALSSTRSARSFLFCTRVLFIIQKHFSFAGGMTKMRFLIKLK